MYSVDNQLKIEDFIFPYGELDRNNRWVKLAAIIPWDEFEETYAKQFINNGRPAKPLRIALGSLIIKQKLNCSDRETVSAIVENPYLQYFIGLKELQNSAPFGASSMVEFRKRISDDMIIEMNNTILKDATTKKNNDDKDKHDNDDNNNSDKANQGTIIVDATCTPADITYPQDLNLLNSAREKLEGYIDYLHVPSESKKPRTYRLKARKDFLNVSKARKKSCKKIRKAIRKQLNYIARDIAYVENFIVNGKKLNSRQLEEYEVILQLYHQQKYMFDNRKHTVENRIVSIGQPHVRLIVRGKTKAPTEFGAKVEISVVNGYVRMEKLSWDAYNECESLIPIIETYKARNGFYPERILADKIYRNRKKLELLQRK
jgi:IS5 family transposase